MSSLLESMTRGSRPLTNLAGEDRVVLFPSLAARSRDHKHWLINIHGDVSAACPVSLGKRLLLKLLKRAMGATGEEMACPLFQERIARFLARDRAGRRVAVQIGEQLFKLPKKTRRNGHFQTTVRLANEQALAWAETAAVGAEKYIPLSVLGATTCGQAYLLEPTGVSIISDIDDTLKHSQVACKRTLLANTFLRPYETIPGMAPLFRQWWAEGAAFHYVSSSPWQLYDHLAEHLAQEGFPAGSFHLRWFRLRDHLLRRILLLRRTGKLSVIRGIMRAYPARRFVLVGDSGEHDPEIYGTLARRYPAQVAGIFIRQLADTPNCRRRYDTVFRGIDPALIKRFTDPAELIDVRLQG